MKFRFIPFVAVLGIMLPNPVKAFAGNLAIVLPPDKSVVEGGLISLILKSGQNTVDEVQVSVNNRRATAVKPSDRLYSCYDGVHLSYGLNKIKISGFKNGRKTDEVTADVYYRSDLSPDAGRPPIGFKAFVFHTADNEKGCASCHDLNLSKIWEKDSTDRSPCQTCHKRMLTGYKFVHGPAAVWSCLVCHDRKSKGKKLDVLKPDDKSCSNCHEKSWDSAKYKHGPTAAGNCTACHDPHAADRPYFLRTDTGSLCASCHEDVLSRPHVVSSFSGEGGHPTSRSRDPFNPEREFTCASCHNPHGSESPVFLNGYQEAMSMQGFCRSCHVM